MDLKINKNAILSMVSDLNIYVRGEKYYKEGRVVKIALKSFDSGFEVMTGKVTGTYKDHHMVQIVLTTSGELHRYRCDCDASAVWKGACKHVVAVMLALADKNSKLMKESNAIIASKNINSIFREQFYEDVDKELAVYSGRIHIEPCIIQEGKKVYLKLRLGRDKLYVIRGVKNFIANVKGKAVVRYGNSLEFRHVISAFDKESIALIKIIEGFYEVVDEVENMSPYPSYKSAGINTGDTFIITKKIMDDLFDLYNGGDIYYGPEYSKASMEKLFLTDTLPDSVLNLEYSPDANEIKLKGKKVDFNYIEGYGFDYYVCEGVMHRVLKDYGWTLTNIIGEINALGNQEVDFKNDEFKSFVAYVLPKLSKTGIAKAPELLPVVERANIETKIYLDYEGKNLVCRVEFQYGDVTIDPLSASAENDTDILRNVYEEYTIVNTLKAYGFEERAYKGQFVLFEEDAIFEFCVYGLKIIGEKAQVHVTDDFTRKKVRSEVKPTFGIRVFGDLLELDLGNNVYSIDELMEALSSYRLKKRYHRLKDGKFIDLEDENTLEYMEVLAQINISKKNITGNAISLEKYRAIHIDSILDNVTGDEAYHNLVRDFENYDSLDFDIPDNLDPILRSYQKTGYKWLKTLSYYGFGGILADDMGLGKTIQVIALLQSEIKTKEHPSIVVTPTSLMYNWKHEFDKFAADLTVVILEGTAENRKQLIDKEAKADVFIITYDTLKRDIDNFKDMEFWYVIADEAQYIKNPGTQNAKAIKKLRSHGRFALTGTPIENSLAELWSIFDFVMPGYLYSYGAFSANFEAPIIKDNNKEKAKELKKQIAPFILRRLKTDVLSELPDKVETTLYAEMLDEQKKIYAAQLMEVKKEVEQALLSGNMNNKRIQILANITRLRQICCHPEIFLENYTGGSAKLDLAIETIVSAIESGHRILFFSQFTSMLEIICNELNSRSISFFYLDGKTESRLRKNIADRFNQGEKSIFLISLKAGGLGLNLTGADVVIHYDQWWNPAVMAQASDRAHRFGQEKVVQVINIIAKDTIEEKILELQEKKRDLIDTVISEGENFINKMSVEQLQELFSIN